MAWDSIVRVTCLYCSYCQTCALYPKDYACPPDSHVTVQGIGLTADYQCISVFCVGTENHTFILILFAHYYMLWAVDLLSCH